MLFVRIVYFKTPMNLYDAFFYDCITVGTLYNVLLE